MGSNRGEAVPENWRSNTAPSLEDYRWRIANTMMGSTTLRNQGASGVKSAARTFLAALDLSRFVTDDGIVFQQELDLQTEQLRQALPEGAQHWGTARKALNLFLGEAYFHRVLCQAYGLERIAEFLEVPLDSQVAEFLRDNAWKSGKIYFRSWATIKGLTPEESRQYQDYAAKLAKSFGTDWVRIHLDVITWRKRPDS